MATRADYPRTLTLTQPAWILLRRVLAEFLPLGPEALVSGVAGSTGIEESKRYVALGMLSGILIYSDTPSPLTMDWNTGAGICDILAGDGGILSEGYEGYSDEEMLELKLLWNSLSDEDWDELQSVE